MLNKTRLENLSDGIFAIILTLLALELRVPVVHEGASPQALWEALMALFPKFLAWANGFFTLMVIWLNHHRFFQMFRKIDRGLFWWNNALVFWVALIPFATAVLGEYIQNPMAVCLYGAIMVPQAFTWLAGRLYLQANPGLLVESVSLPEFRRGTIATLIFGPIAYGGVCAVAWIHPFWGVALSMAIALYFVLPHSTKDLELPASELSGHHSASGSK